MSVRSAPFLQYGKYWRWLLWQTTLWCRLSWGLVESPFGRSLELGGRSLLVHLASVAEKMFSYLIYSIKTFYKICTFTTEIMVQYIVLLFNTIRFKVSFPSTFTEHAITTVFTISRILIKRTKWFVLFWIVVYTASSVPRSKHVNKYSPCLNIVECFILALTFLENNFKSYNITA